MASRVLGFVLLFTATCGIDSAQATNFPLPTVAATAFAQDGDSSEESPASDAEDAETIGLDEKIDEAFDPIATKWEALVTYSIPGTGAPLVLFILVGGALFFTIYFAFVNIRRFPLAINVVRGKYDELEGGNEPITTTSVNVVDGDVVDTIRDEGEGEVSHFQALATAVSGTVGLGNIGGVAVAIATGGPGATFWMIMCGLLGMCTKFVECTLGVKYRDVDPDGTVYGGPMYYLKKGLQDRGLAPLGTALGALFAVLCVGASFGGGNAFQSNQAAKQLNSVYGLDAKLAEMAPGLEGSTGFIIGTVLAVLVGIVIIGGIKRIASVTEKIVPFMAVMYVLACITIIAMNIQHIGTAVSQIISQAFTPAAGLGGLAGVLIVGFQRAAFSNEAGAGSAAIAHSAVKTKYPASEGIVALLEPFIDTVVICTMTALVIVFFNIDGTNAEGVPAFKYGNLDASKSVIMEDGSAALGGVDLTSAAFASKIPWFPHVLTVAIVLFAFSTLISWSYYGMQSWKYLFGKSKAADLTFKLLFLVFIIIGASAKLDAVIKFSDAMILALVFPNMIGLILLAPKVKEELNKYLSAIKASK
ncbi:MAG: alanine/glycine:cation symporter family protein [Planctomycetaceae bacterium]